MTGALLLLDVGVIDVLPLPLPIILIFLLLVMFRSAEKVPLGIRIWPWLRVPLLRSWIALSSESAPVTLSTSAVLTHTPSPVLCASARSHALPVTQPVLSLHPLAQAANGLAEASHSDGSHLTLLGLVPHLPAPSHSSCARVLPLLQLPPHAVVAGAAFWQARAPSQNSAPHGALPLHSSAGSLPAGTGLQVPSLPVTLHASHVPPHAVSQQ